MKFAQKINKLIFESIRVEMKSKKVINDLIFILKSLSKILIYFFLPFWVCLGVVKAAGSEISLQKLRSYNLEHDLVQFWDIT